MDSRQRAINVSGNSNVSQDGHVRQDSNAGQDGEVGQEGIGELIARVRMELGISQLRLAARLCASAGINTVTRHEISRWERGDRLPSAFWLGWLAETLAQPIDRLDRAVVVSRRRRAGGDQLPPPRWIARVA